MARNIRWQATFLSLSGRTGRIDIYDEGWPSGNVTQLIPAATPVTIDEDDDENLLNVIRAKTGYISFIEENYGDLADLYPTTNKSHYVEISYNYSKKFCGYMQAQAFEQPAGPGPTVLSFPITTALGLLGDFRFAPITTPHEVTLGELLAEVIQNIEVPYSQVIIPRLDTATNCWLSKRINSLVVSPFNSDYSQVRDVDSDLFTPITYQEFLEGICNAWGMILQDNGTDLVFRRVDYTGTYLVVDTSILSDIGSGWDSISSVHGDSVTYLSSYYDWCDDDASISLVKPFERITREFEGDYIGSMAFDFGRLKFMSRGGTGYLQVAFLRSETPELVGDYLQDSNTFDSSGYLYSYGVNALVYAHVNVDGTLEKKEKMLCINVNSSWSLNTDLFHVVFYERPYKSDFYLNYTLKWGDRVWSMTDESEDAHYTVGINVRVNGYYYHGGGEWNTSPIADAGLSIDSWHLTNTPDGPIDIIFKLASKPENAQRLIAIEDLKLTENEEIWSEFTEDKNAPVIIKNGNGDGMDEESISNLLSTNHSNSNIVKPWTTSEPTYPYLMKSQKRLVAKYKMKLGVEPTWPLIPLFRDGNNEDWRIIARSYDLWNDEVMLILHKSDEFN